MLGLADLLADADDDMLFVEDEVTPAEDHKRRNAEPSLRSARAHGTRKPERGTKRDREQGMSETAADREQGTSETAQLDDPIAAAQSYRQRTAAEGTRRYECHLCLQLFQSGHALNAHLASKADTKHSAHRARMFANKGISKAASIDHREAMAREDPKRRDTGVGARVVFLQTGDVVEVVERKDESWAWGLAGGRICKMKTEGQRWVWECDWTRLYANGEDARETADKDRPSAR